MNILPNGIGETVGDNLVLCKPLQLSGNIWYVCSIGGLDAASPAGKSKEHPLATLAQAVTNAADDDVIVLLTGHSESIAAVVTIAKRLTIVGVGTSGGLPSVQLTHVFGGFAIMLAVTATNVELRNIRFTGHSTFPRVNVAAAATMFRATGCYFECEAQDAAGSLALAAGADQVRLANCTFISTGGALGLPMDGLKITAGAVTNLELYGCVFSDGAAGFTTAAFNATQNVTKLKAEGLSLLMGALLALTAGSTGYVNVQTSTGNGRVSW